MTMLEPMQLSKETKGPLQSKTLGLGAVALIGGLVAKKNPDFGKWISDNADTILTVFGGLVVAFRPLSSKSIDWKDLTLFGIGKKF